MPDVDPAVAVDVDVESAAGAGPVEEALAAARALLRGNPYGFLTTLGAAARRDASGQVAYDGAVPHARLVQHLAVTDDLTVWIGTSPRSRKVADLAANPDSRVAYAVEDRAAFAYLSISATVTVVDDERERAAKWEEGLAAFFPAGPLGDDFVLLRLDPRRLELMDFSRRLHPDPFGLVPVVVERRAGIWTAAPPDRAP
ncbi:pyridoxamine 5'-phosphate oxidase family protein [Frankia gtarii]|uniref:pyridoxamine 5'-phosphate oxidase family protein n=1 Tax=Frankia gtarii TaxID=2950102 RepID=UPI0021BF0CD9|nr:pyridoxamine 5'-phosphate oxidase family protein [Frankia gtarii]